MAAKEPEKKIPSTAAKATTRSPGGTTESHRQHPIQDQYTGYKINIRADEQEQGAQVFTVVGVLVADPVERPVGLLLHTRQSLDGVEQVFSEGQ